MSGGKLAVDIVYRDAHLYHQYHYVISKVRYLIYGLSLVVSLSGDDDLCTFLANLLEYLIYTFVKEVGRVRAVDVRALITCLSGSDQ